MILEMKTLIKTGLTCFSFIILASCQKTELIPDVSDSSGSTEANGFHQDGTIDLSGADIFTDKDKCKKCHTGKSMEIDWSAPYMSDNRYKSIEDLVNDFDFAKNVHPLNSGEKHIFCVTTAQKQELIDYLSKIAAQAQLSGK